MIKLQYGNAKWMFFLLLTFVLAGCFQEVSSPMVELVTVTEIPSTPRPTLMPVLTATEIVFCYRVTADKSLYIRDAADYEVGAVVGYLAHGDLVHTMSAPSSGWLSVTGGWVSARFVELTSCP
jgi:hypothetical protein